MVAFFNKKEDVIEIQLTQYGKYLLSLGLFKPSFYAFYDDDILYDSEYGGFTEYQNKAEGRIQNETPSLHTISTLSSVESRVNTFISNVTNEIGQLSGENPEVAFAFQNQQPFKDKMDLLSTPLGNSSLDSSKAPSWTIIPLNENTIISGSRISMDPFAGTIPTDNSRVVQRIPQLNIEVDYKSFFQKGPIGANSITNYITDSTYLAVDRKYLVLDVLEENSEFLKENFDIEVFFVSASTGPASSGSIVPENIQMSFIDPSSDMLPRSVIQATTTPNVEYYMDILVDDELPSNAINELNIKDAVRPGAGRLRLNKDLYTTDDEECC